MRDHDEYRCFVQLLIGDLFELTRDAKGSIQRHCGGNVPQILTETLAHHSALLDSKLGDHTILKLVNELLESMETLEKTNAAYVEDERWNIVRINARKGLNAILKIDLL